MRRSSAAFVLPFALVGCVELEPLAPESPVTTAQFSAAAGFGTTEDWEILVADISDGALSDPAVAAPYRAQLRPLLEGPQPYDMNVARNILRDWFNREVRPRLGTANNDHTLISALSEFWNWYINAEAFLGDALDEMLKPQIHAFDMLAGMKIKRAIDGNLDVCRTAQSLGALANVLWWFSQADGLQLLGVPTFPISSEDEVLDLIWDLCATVVASTAQLAEPIEVPQSHLLRTVFGVQFLGATSLQQAAFGMTIDPTTLNATIFSAPSFSDAAGVWEAQVGANAVDAGVVSFDLDACLVLPGRTDATGLCGGATLSRTVIAPPPPPPPPPPTGVDVSGTWEADFTYTGATGQNPVPARITLVLTQSGSSASGTWTLDDGIHSGSISFTVGGIDPACPGCGYLITNFDMTGVALGRWFLNASSGGGHVGDPARGASMVMDIFGIDGHIGADGQHTWNTRRVLFRPVVP